MAFLRFFHILLTYGTFILEFSEFNYDNGAAYCYIGNVSHNIIPIIIFKTTCE